MMAWQEGKLYNVYIMVYLDYMTGAYLVLLMIGGVVEIVVLKFGTNC